MSTPAQRVQRIFDEAVGRDLNSWEKYEFLPSIKVCASLTAAQENKLREIERKIFGEEEEE